MVRLGTAMVLGCALLGACASPPAAPPLARSALSGSSPGLQAKAAQDQDAGAGLGAAHWLACATWLGSLCDGSADSLLGWYWSTNASLGLASWLPGGTAQTRSAGPEGRLGDEPGARKAHSASMGWHLGTRIDLRLEYNRRDRGPAERAASLSPPTGRDDYVGTTIGLDF